MKKLAVSQWVKKVAAYLSEDGGADAAIVRVEDDGSYVDAALNDVEKRLAGHYRLIDADGKTIAETVISADGERQSRNSNPATTVANSLAREREAVTNSWDRLTTHLTSQLEDRDKTIKEQLATIANLQEQLAEKIAAENEDDSAPNELSELIKVGGDILTQKMVKRYVSGMLERIAPQLSPECLAELMPHVEREFAALQSSGIAPLLGEGN